MATKYQTKEKEHVENELTKLLELTLFLENELYCVADYRVCID